MSLRSVNFIKNKINSFVCSVIPYFTLTLRWKTLKTTFFKSIFSPSPRTLVHLIPIYQNLHFIFYFTSFTQSFFLFSSYIICCVPKVRFCFLPFSISFAFSPSYRTRERYQSWGRVLPPASAIYFSSLADPKGAMRRGSISKLNDLGNCTLFRFFRF